MAKRFMTLYELQQAKDLPMEADHLINDMYTSDHVAGNDDQKHRLVGTRNLVRALARQIITAVPKGESRNKALDALQQVRWLCDQAIFSEGRY